ncbi:hypothetical protein QAD02_011401 [Eretmocerus hayati]|uniref:Uncharacterized protein n=1 Tax=Eretmocerus hayati TaxID=131215 RepID=A0ACC2P1E4_9HYME|nr:hypothetical protein QAD02_011401 [Eretmocerus hayati]
MTDMDNIVLTTILPLEILVYNLHRTVLECSLRGPIPSVEEVIDQLDNYCQIAEHIQIEEYNFGKLQHLLRKFYIQYRECYEDYDILAPERLLPDIMFGVEDRLNVMLLHVNNANDEFHDALRIGEDHGEIRIDYKCLTKDNYFFSKKYG